MDNNSVTHLIYNGLPPSETHSSAVPVSVSSLYCDMETTPSLLKSTRHVTGLDDAASVVVVKNGTAKNAAQIGSTLFISKSFSKSVCSSMRRDKVGLCSAAGFLAQVMVVAMVVVAFRVIKEVFVSNSSQL